MDIGTGIIDTLPNEKLNTLLRNTLYILMQRLEYRDAQAMPAREYDILSQRISLAKNLYTNLYHEVK